MRVQKINMMEYRPVFRQNKRNTNGLMGRSITLQDLYDMEDRLTAHMDENYKNQNQMIGDALYKAINVMDKLSHRNRKDSDVSDAFSKAFHSANSLSESNLISK